MMEILNTFGDSKLPKNTVIHINFIHKIFVLEIFM